MGWFQNLSIRFKILAILIIAGIGYVINLGINVSASSENTTRLENIKNIYFPTLERIDTSLVHLDKIKETLNQAVSSAEAEMIGEADKHASQIKQAFDEILAFDPTVESNIKNLQNQFNDYYTKASAITRGIINNSIQGNQLGVKASEMVQSLQIVQENMKHFRETSYDRFTNTIKQANSSAKKTLSLGLLVTLVVLLAVGITGFLISSLISKNVKNALDSLQYMVDKGDLTARINCNSNDEIGKMVDGFNYFISDLQNTMKQVEGATAQLSTASEEVSVISEQENRNIHEQQSQTEQVATSMNEMVASVQEVAKTAHQTADAAQDARDKAGDGRRIVEQTIGSINLLATEVDKTTDVIHRLESNCESIGSVLDVIRGIAEQTNLLALNAAIEAARAGEQGRGFAVVADEVRTLASRTQESTLEIQKTVETLLSGAAEAVNVMESNRTHTQTSVENAARAGDALGDITQAVSKISDMNTQIASASEEQGAVANEINTNISNINDAASQSTRSTQQTTEASEKLAQLAIELQSQVSKFKI